MPNARACQILNLPCKNFGRGQWAEWYEVAEHSSEISILRPFYPVRPGNTSQLHLKAAHETDDIDVLRRRCERATTTRRAACPLFWTLGGNQVGKAAISGWREVLAPALAKHKASLWPFDGTLNELATADDALILAKTYPAEFYHHLGVAFNAQESKTRQSDRLKKAPAIKAWARNNKVTVLPALMAQIDNGFGQDSLGEDRFDAVIGMLGMINIVLGLRPEGPPDDPAIGRWEGWILGQTIAASRLPLAPFEPSSPVRALTTNEGPSTETASFILRQLANCGSIEGLIALYPHIPVTAVLSALNEAADNLEGA